MDSLKSEADVEVKLLSPLFQDVLGYPSKDLAWHQPVRFKLGRETLTKQADLVASQGGSAVIAVEAKRPTESVRTGFDQVDSYAGVLQTPYSVITNGRHFVLRGYYAANKKINIIDDSVDVLSREKWKQVQRLIGFTNVRAAIAPAVNDVPLPNPDQIKNYRQFFRRIHNEIRDRDKLDPGASFDELSKLLFLKAAEDEWRGRVANRPALTPERIAEWELLGADEATRLINEWFAATTGAMFPNVFEGQPRLTLTPPTLRAVLDLMKPFRVKNGDVDVKGRAFEEFLPSQLRGKGLGQFFTPRPIVNFMVDLAAVSLHDVVVDFSCGSGGFLIKSFEQMKRYVEELPAVTLRRLGVTQNDLLGRIKSDQLFGVDAEPRAARTAKMNMLMWGDGERVVRGNALDTKDVAGKPYEPNEYAEADPTSGCTLILANPPFGSTEKDPAILRRYTLGSRLRESKGEKTEVLFIEKGLKLLRPEGRMLIVLPQGLMSGDSNDRVRDYIHSEAEIRAVISLPTHTFVQSGVPTVNTCILYVQKFTAEKKRLYDERAAGLAPAAVRQLIRTDPDFDYPIFMGTAEYIGYEPSGRPIGGPGEKTDLDLLLADFASDGEIGRPDVDLFEFAREHYDERAYRRKDQVVRGTTRGLKTSFVVNLRETEDRLDPPFYLLRYQAGDLLASLAPLGDRIKERKGKFAARSDDELDTEYATLSVSSDGTVTLSERIRGEDLLDKKRQKPRVMKRVAGGDVVYNPMRINIGSIGVVPDDLDGGLVSPDYVVLRCSGIDPHFLVAMLRTPFYRMYLDVISTGSIRDRVYFSALKAVRLPVVATATQQAVRDLVAEFENESANLMAELRESKDRLLAHLDKLTRADWTTTRFRELADRWRDETGMLSSVTKILKHPAYLEILRMAKADKAAMLPLVLRELQDTKGLWFDLLRTVAPETPVTDDIRSDPKRVREAWLRWGQQNNYLPKNEG